MTFVPLEALVPHRTPMLWLDEMVARDGDAVRCRVAIRRDHVFVENGRVEPMIAIEWMAQTVATLAGLRDRDAGCPPRPGYLIAIPQASFEVDAFEVGDELQIDARRVWGDDQLGSFECTVTRRGAVCASGKLSVYRRTPGPGEET